MLQNAPHLEAMIFIGACPFVENRHNYTAWEFAQMYTNWTATSIFRNLGLFRRNLPVQVNYNPLTFSHSPPLKVGSNPNTTSTRDVCILPRYECHSSTTPRQIIGRSMHISAIGNCSLRKRKHSHKFNRSWRGAIRLRPHRSPS